MSEFLIKRQRLFDRLNLAEENLRQSTRDQVRAADQVEYWRKQIETLKAQLEDYRTE